MAVNKDGLEAGKVLTQVEINQYKVNKRKAAQAKPEPAKQEKK